MSYLIFNKLVCLNRLLRRHDRRAYVRIFGEDDLGSYKAVLRYSKHAQLHINSGAVVWYVMM